MLVLFETPAGFAIFKLLDEKRIQQSENLFQDFKTPEGASRVVKLKQFSKFGDTAEALAAATAAVESKMSKSLRKFLKQVIAKDAQEQLAVADAKLGNCIKEKLNLSCITDSSIAELMRCIRSQAENLLPGLPQKEMTAMALGLAHSLSRYKLKFSPDKVDTMIVQAVSLLDELDKELNNYIMRCREWYGWHFPELGKLIPDNIVYVHMVKAMGVRSNAATADLSDVVSEDVEEKIKEVAEISMGTDISEEDIDNIQHLCEQVIEIQDYRAQLFEYLKNRMMAIAPNLTVLVGELVGARLIAHAGSLINLAKHPASTVQILGAEKALFRALKTKSDTPKYGLIYHAQLVGNSEVKVRGKVSRMLAAKTSLATRVDALGEEVTVTLGLEHKAKLEGRIRMLEEGALRRISGTGRQKAMIEKYTSVSKMRPYTEEGDITIPSSKKRKREGDDEEMVPKKIKIEVKEEQVEVTSETEKKKKRKKVSEGPEDSGGATAHEFFSGVSFLQSTPITTETGKEKKKKIKQELETSVEGADDEPFGGISSVQELSVEGGESDKKKKKKKVKREPGEGDTTAGDSTLGDTTAGDSFLVAGEEKIKKKKVKTESGEGDTTAGGSTLGDTTAGDSLLAGGEEKKKKKKKKSKGSKEGDTLEADTTVGDTTAGDSFVAENVELAAEPPQKKKKKKKSKQEAET